MDTSTLMLVMIFAGLGCLVSFMGREWRLFNLSLFVAFFSALGIVFRWLGAL